MARSTVGTNLDLVTEEVEGGGLACSLESKCGGTLVVKGRPVADQAAAEAWATTRGIPAAQAARAAAGGCLWHETATPDCYSGGGG